MTKVDISTTHSYAGKESLASAVYSTVDVINEQEFNLEGNAELLRRRKVTNLRIPLIVGIGGLLTS